MLANIKSRFISVLAPDLPSLPSPLDHKLYRGSHSRMHDLQDKFVYSRPQFLQLVTPDELRASADHNVRPIIVPRDINVLPWSTGYAECVNSGKSEWNEDQAAYCRNVLSDPTHKHPDVPYTYFGIFDGHAGYGAALAASHQFHHILHEKLVDCIDMLLPRDEESSGVPTANSFPHPSHFHRRVSKDELIIGALESAFFHMDALIAQDRDRYRDAGGCTACVSLFINGKMFVANAGDSRAVLCQRKRPSTANIGDTTTSEAAPIASVANTTDTIGAYHVPFSFDHTPETERHRLLNVARLKPSLLEKQYAAMEYAKRPHAKDLGQRILCRKGTMRGWTYKTLTLEDLRMPVVTGEGKRSRLLGTLGVTRGFGDHDLLAINTGTLIKPFLTPHPDVNYRDLSKIVSIPDEGNEEGDYGILVMATDGLWDVSENDAVARTVFQTLGKYPTERHRYTMVAQELVAKARGKVNDSGHWRLADSKAAATVDDISVLVIPVFQYYKEHMQWEAECARVYFEQLRKEVVEAAETVEEQQSAVNGEVLSAGDIETIEEDEEIVVELSEDKGIDKNQEHGELYEKMDTSIAAVSIDFEMEDMEEESSGKVGEKDVKQLLDAELAAAISALEATEILPQDLKSAKKQTVEAQKKQSQQPQQQRSRNRREKHQ